MPRTGIILGFAQLVEPRALDATRKGVVDALRESRYGEGPSVVYLHHLLAADEPLFTAHCMKDQLRLFWAPPNAESGRHFLETPCKEARESGIEVLSWVGKILSGYRTGLLNHFKHRITNAMAEGLHHKIKTLERQAYGLCHREYSVLRLYPLHTQRCSLSG